MAIDKNEFISTYTLDDSITINAGDLFYDTSSNNTMYYTSNTGTINTITLTNSSYPTSPSYTVDNASWDTYGEWFKKLKEFEDTMPELTKIKEMCTMYPAMDKAYENFKAIYDLIKDDYEARKNNDI